MNNIEIIKYALEANLKSLEVSEKVTQNVKTGIEKSSVKKAGTGTSSRYVRKVSASIKKVCNETRKSTKNYSTSYPP